MGAGRPRRDPQRRAVPGHGDDEDRVGPAALGPRPARGYTDGGGVVTAARKPIYGAAKIARFLVGVQRKSQFPDDPVYTPVLVNGDPGVRMDSASGGFLSIVAIEVAEGTVQGIRFFNNPERFPVKFSVS